MPLRSHVDLCLFVRMLRAEREPISADEIDDLEHAQDQERALRVWRKQYDSNPMVWFHEQYHYWQGLRLPFLFWYAAFSLRAVLTGFAEFLETCAPLDQWSGDAPMLNYLSTASHCVHFGGGSFMVFPNRASVPPEFPPGVDLAPLDLIEGMASIAEWQVQAPKTEMEEVRSFKRWAKRNPAYLHAFRFVWSALGDESLALRIFCPLVEAAFHTSHPVRGFINLLHAFFYFRQSKMGAQTIAQREPVWWPEVFRDLLKQVKFEGPPDSLKGVLVDHPYCLLDRENWIAGAWEGSDFLNPFLTPNARKWVALEKQMPAYEWLIAQPGWAPKQVFREAIEEFYPPLTILHFALKDGTNRVILGADPEGAAADSLKSGNLLTLLTAFSVVRRATQTHYNPNIRLCHHSDCPYYVGNFCNLYPVIPKDWKDCGFPARVEQISTLLEPVVRRGKWKTR